MIRINRSYDLPKVISSNLLEASEDLSEGQELMPSSQNSALLFVVRVMMVVVMLNLGF